MSEKVKKSAKTDHELSEFACNTAEVRVVDVLCSYDSPPVPGNMAESKDNAR